MGVLSIIKEVISLEIQTLEDLKSSIDESFARAVDMILSSYGKVVLSGMGKSGLIARKIAATFSSTGTSSIFLHPSEALHGDLGVVEKKDIVILLGKSGESDEIVGMLPALKKMECGIIAITANESSTLAKHSDIVLRTPVKQEACALNLAPTCSTTAALATGDALAVALMRGKKFSRRDFAFYHPGGRIGKRLLYKVADLMKSGDENPLVGIEERFLNVVAAVTEGKVNAVSVVDDQGVFRGLITGYDIRKAIQFNDNVRELKAGAIMTYEPVVISSEAYAMEAFQVMKNNSKPLLLLPVVDNGKAEGIITMQDMIRAGL